MRDSSCLSRLVLSNNFLLVNRIRQIYLDFVDRNLTRDDRGPTLRLVMLLNAVNLWGLSPTIKEI